MIIINKVKLNKLRYLLFICSAFIYTSCIKDVDYTVDNEGVIYMAQGADSKSLLELYDIDTIQDIFIGASYGGLNYPNEDIPLKFIVDETLINSYNLDNGTNYVAFPTTSYSISGLESTIKSGTVNSEPLKVMVTAKALQIGTAYMLPVKLVSAGSSNINANSSIAFFRIDSLIRRERDLTGLGTLSVSHENNGGSGHGEGSPKLVDNNYGSKYLTQAYTAGMWFQLKYNTPQVLGAYSFTSANDASERDPKTWRLEASTDGSGWVTLDRKVDYFFSERNQTRRFEFSNNTPYLYYRVVVESNNGSNLFQMAEWRMIQYY